jgi:hypothetical protein
MAAPGLAVQLKERPRLLRQAMRAKRAERPLVAIVRGAAADAPASAREAHYARRSARSRTTHASARAPHTGTH